MSAGTTTGCTLGRMLKQSRLSRGLSLQTVASNAGITPMYLSLIERNACGPPIDEKLQSLAEVFGEQHVETFFAKAGRVTPRVVNTILRHPTQWSELIEAAKDFDADHLAGLKSFVLLHQGAGKSYLGKFLAKYVADLSLADEKAQRKRPAKDKAGLQRDTKERSTTPKEARVSSVRRAKRVRNAPGFLPGQAGHP
jgi:transcriptional regulator with XRE-family HTH domain